MIKFLDVKKINSKYEKQIQKVIYKTIKSGNYINGYECKNFEIEFAKYCGTKYCVGVGNGLDALSLTLNAWKKLKKLNQVMKLLFQQIHT